MKFAVQSIVWGRDVEDIEQMLRQIRSAGYRGVELFQDIADERYGGPAGLFEVFRDCDVSLIGILSGSIAERVDFIKAYCNLLGVSIDDESAPYIYVDEWNQRCADALNDNMRIALHPHMFRPVQTMAEATKILNDYNLDNFPNLQLMPDTAHSTIAGDDPVKIVKDNFERIAAIHIKDWTPIVGRSYQFYASGFCPLGEGDVEVHEVMDVLWKRKFEGWVVVEQDYSTKPRQSIEDANAWLRSVLPPTIQF